MAISDCCQIWMIRLAAFIRAITSWFKGTALQFPHERWHSTTNRAQALSVSARVYFGNACQECYCIRVPGI